MRLQSSPWVSLSLTSNRPRGSFLPREASSAKRTEDKVSFSPQLGQGLHFGSSPLALPMSLLVFSTGFANSAPIINSEAQLLSSASTKSQAPKSINNDSKNHKEQSVLEANQLGSKIHSGTPSLEYDDIYSANNPGRLTDAQMAKVFFWELEKKFPGRGLRSDRIATVADNVFFQLWPNRFGAITMQRAGYFRQLFVGATEEEARLGDGFLTEAEFENYMSRYNVSNSYSGE